MVNKPEKSGVYTTNDGRSRGGIPWWVWLIGALVLLGLLWLLFSGNEEETEAIQPATTLQEPAVVEPNAVVVEPEN